jgi:c-di-GMP-binding flagellar brake protein YcgR
MEWPTLLYSERRAGWYNASTTAQGRELETRMEPTRARKYPRIAVDLPVEYFAESGTDRTRALMMGGGGMFLRTAQPLVPGTDLLVRFRPAKHLPVVEAKARVCYLVPGRGIGVEFTDIQSQHRRHILRLIHHRNARQRHFPRVLLATQVEHAEGSLIGFSRDLSTGGMFVETNQLLDPGQRLNLRFHLDNEEAIVKTEAEVLYQIPRVGIGLQFTEVSPEDYERIREYVTRRDASAAPSGKPRGH